MIHILAAARNGILSRPPWLADFYETAEGYDTKMPITSVGTTHVVESLVDLSGIEPLTFSFVKTMRNE